MKRRISLICLFLVLAMLAVGCQKTSDDPNDGADSTTVDTGDQYDANGYIKDSIPSDLKYGGEVITIMGWSHSDGARDFNEDTEREDRIALRTFSRNREVERRLDVELSFNRSLQGGNSGRQAYTEAVERALMTGTKYDLIACYSMNASNLAADDFLINLNEQSVLDFDKPWWPTQLLETSTINDKLYFASGSISTASIMQSLVIAVNLDMLRSYGLDDPREVVSDGDWTMNKFYEMCTDTYVDHNKEVDGKDAGDKFGFVTIDSVVGDAFLISNGLKYLSTDDDGKIIIAPEFKGQKIHDLSESLIQKFKTDDFYYSTTASTKPFTEQRAIFMGIAFDTLVEIKADIGFEYGYLPFPKADDNQENYRTCVGFPFTMWCIPQQAADYQRSAYVMECLASEGYRQVQPEVYQEVKYRLGSDALNAEMFEIIIASMSNDIGRIFHDEFEWENSPVATFRTRLY
ncbi:MAG: hypothetical protein IKC59_00575 [Clostridia bacterium]|nr:hypothetical protein [Clostridia bacterium]